MAAPTKQPYLSQGQMLSSPPLSARLRSFSESAYTFCALYLITLFSLDPNAAAEASSFNVRNRGVGNSRPKSSSWGFGGGSYSGGGGGGPGSGGGGGKKLGRVDDIRGPECKSCQS